MGGFITDGNEPTDSGEREYIHAGLVASTVADTIIYTPAAGKRIRLWWVYALNNPAANTPSLITVKIGSKVHSVTYGVSKRQKFVGAVDESLMVALDIAGTVAVTAILEEI
jgi:hypothetical protein